MQTRQIKTISIAVKEWFDKSAGNSYFGGFIIINKGKPNAITLSITFQYGYGDHYRHEAFKIIKKQLNTFKTATDREAPWSFYNRNNISAVHSKIENCRKRDVIEYSKI